YAAGQLVARFPGKWLLVFGWLVALPVPIVLLYAPTWGWVLAANVLLGIAQGITWSTTLLLKIDLVGPERRGFAVGANETAGYASLALAAWVTGMMPGSAPFVLGAALALAGLGASLALPDTAPPRAGASATSAGRCWTATCCTRSASRSRRARRSARRGTPGSCRSSPAGRGRRRCARAR
ncbi:MAG: MFS transporter, partial [Myxococcota bacterium]